MISWGLKNIPIKAMHVINSRKHIYEKYSMAYIKYCYPYPNNFKVTLNYISSIYCLKPFCKLFHLFPVSSELFVRQNCVCLWVSWVSGTFFWQTMPRIYPNHFDAHNRSVQSILYATRCMISDDLFLTVTLSKWLGRAWRFMECMCHRHFKLIFLLAGYFPQCLVYLLM